MKHIESHIYICFLDLLYKLEIIPGNMYSNVLLCDKTSVLLGETLTMNFFCASKQMGKQWKQWQTLFWGAPKSLQMVTAAIKLKEACSLEVMTNPDSILKSRDITLSTKVQLVKAMVYPVVMYGCESWTIKKAECRRIDAFDLWCWRRFLRVPWTAGRSNQSILKEISPGYSLERLMLKLKLQYFGHLMLRTDSFEKTLMPGKINGGRRRGRQRMRWLDGITDSMDMGLNKLRCWWRTGKPGVLQSMGLQRVGHDWATEPNQKERRSLAKAEMTYSCGCVWWWW